MMRAPALAVLAAAAFAAGCGGAADELSGVPACKAWLDAVDACARTAPTAMRESLTAMVTTVRESNRDAPSGARLEEACTTAMARLEREATALCPDVAWRAPKPQ